MKTLFLLLFIALQPANVWAGAQDHAVLTNRISDFVQQQTATLPGKAIFHVNDVDSRLILAPCNKLETFLPNGSKLIGSTSVGIRCIEKETWSIIVPVQIKYRLELWVSARQLPAGHTIQQQDLTPQIVEISQSSGITDPAQAIGKVLRNGIATGQAIREDMLRAPYVVHQGQTVTIMIQSTHFSVRNSGVAMNDAGAGAPVKVKSESGRMLSGVARTDGVVEILP